MKQLCLLLCIVTGTAIHLFAQQSGQIRLSGILKGFNNQVELQDMSEFQYILPPLPERMIVPDSAGRFSITFKATSANYYRIGANILYLSPGDDLQIFINDRHPDSTFFKGRGAEANTYLKRTPFPKAGSYLEAGFQLKETTQATISHIEKTAAARRRELDRVTHVPKEFRRLETARIKADLINSIDKIKIYTIWNRALKGEDSLRFLQEFDRLATPKIRACSRNFADVSLMKLVVYRDISDEVIRSGGDPLQVQHIKDWLMAYDLVAEMAKVQDKEELKAYASKLNEVHYAPYHNAVMEMQKHYMSFGKGDPAKDFTATDLTGASVKLSSLKGKVIYVDLWATWCMPCLQEMPHFEKLKERYKDNPDVVFLSLSIDDAADAWKKNIAKRNAGGYQWIINRNRLTDYNIVSIPRSLLIDKDFRIVSMNAAMPSDKELVGVIEGLL